MATREITDEQAGEIAEQLAELDEVAKYSDDPFVRGDVVFAVAEIRRLLGFLS